jgi:hypothetical protein
MVEFRFVEVTMLSSLVPINIDLRNQVKMRIALISITFASLFGGMIYLAEQGSPSSIKVATSNECEMTHIITSPVSTHGRDWIGHTGQQLIDTMGTDYVAWNTNVFGILQDGLAYTYEVEGLRCVHTYTMGKCDIVIDYNCY